MIVGNFLDRSQPFCTLLARAICFLSLAGGSALDAQERTADNAITQAEDAFGFSIGRESVGIYSATNARGFSPTTAGNVRLDGLYFDPEIGLNTAISDSASVKVGISAQGYPFSAPSGVVDYRLNRPGSRTVASVIGNADSFGTAGSELDGSVPLTSTLSLGLGATLARNEFSDGTRDWENSQTLIARWRPSAKVELVPFWMRIADVDAPVGTQYLPGGPFLPPQPPQALFIGPNWVLNRAAGTNAGIIATVGFGNDWLLHAGAFRSVNNLKRNFSNLLTDERIDGTGQHVVLADPAQTSRSLSGEVRLGRTLIEGPRLHLIQLSLRQRSTDRQFGGSDEIDLGSGRFDQKFDPPKPVFVFGPVSRDRVRETAVGLSYDGRWKGIGEVSLSASRADYRKTTLLPDEAPAVARSQPWLYDATVAVDLSRALVLYAGYARGLEESGVAPANAVNRNEPLPAILTRQADAGVRIQVAPKLKAVAGLFDLTRPAFGFDSANRFLQIGTTRSRGAEFSLSGNVTPRLSLLVGGVLLDAQLDSAAGVAGIVGRRPAGLPTHNLNASINWRTPMVKGLEIDLAAFEHGRIPTTTDNRVSLPPSTEVDAGAHYHFALAGRPTVLRLRVRDVFNVQTLLYQGPGIYGINFGRYASATLSTDL